MRVIQPIEIITLVMFHIASFVANWYQLSIVVSMWLSLSGLLLTLLLVGYRMLSYTMAFMSEVAPLMTVIRDFLKRFK